MAKIKKIPNDNISELLGGIDKKFIDNDDFLDIVQWNLRWFNSMDKDRAKKIEKVLSLLNSDIFVFQEIADGSLDDIAKSLSENGKGSYQVAYGTTGGQQRIAIMWDMEWVRTKDDIIELFGKNTVTTPNGKDVFPRLPLWSYFFCKSTISNRRGFDFQLVGLHLKSQMDKEGTNEDNLQRTLSAAKLSDWLIKEGNRFDSDIIILGDWNEPPDAEAWESLRNLEKNKNVKFTKINDKTNFSHLYYLNRNDVGSLLDLRVVTSPFAKEMNKTGGTIHWLALEELLSGSATAGEVKKIINEIKTEITDHLPVLTRFGVSKKH
ncbi:MAG: Endonuclease/exonuclease/phosphatase [Ignavibacteria bacterium]|nr:Endonuclease/exonuclease/phosphatase [Ignavibacteria bacterium]